MMYKYLLPLLFLPLFSSGQGFATLEGSIGGASTSEQPIYGITFSGGGYLKPSRTFQLGAGISVNIYGEPFAVPFFQMGYFNPKKKISPYINGRVGYAFLKFPLTDARTNKGGVFLSARAGCGFKISKIARITPFAGIEAYNLRYVVLRETQSSTTAGVFTGGVAMIFGR